MGRARRGSKKRQVAIETLDSDDERAYSKEEVPDPKSSSYYHDEIDDFHMAKEKVLLDKGASIRKAVDISSEEEVLGFSDNDDDNDEKIATYEEQLRKMRGHSVRENLASDLEDESDDDADVNAWGKPKSNFYGADVKLDKKGRKKETKNKYVASDSEDLDADELEEREALLIQRRQAEQLTDDDFGLSLVQTMQIPSDKQEKEHVIVKDLSSLTEQEKRQLLMKESPELIPVIDDYKLKLTELRNSLLPLIDCYKKGFISLNSGVAYIITKAQLYFNYCTNISFYLLLKLQRQSIQDHPVIKRIVEYRNMIRRLAAVDDQLKHQLEELLQKMKDGELVQVCESVKPLRDINIDALLQFDQTITRKKKESKKKLGDTPDVDMEVEDDLKEDEEAEDLVDEDGRRAIDYEIAKNKGLKPQRKKELRNPRVKHKLKYRKALIRRRGQVREVRKEETRYSGEASGIRAGVKKSIKLKV